MNICPKHTEPREEFRFESGHLYKRDANKGIFLCVTSASKGAIMVEVDTGNLFCRLPQFPKSEIPDKWTDVTDQYCLTEI